MTKSDKTLIQQVLLDYALIVPKKLESSPVELKSEDFEWCSMQVKDIKTGKCSNGDIKMFNGNPVYAYLKFKDAKTPEFTCLMITNDKFIVRGQGYTINYSEEWKSFYKSNHKKEEFNR